MTTSRQRPPYRLAVTATAAKALSERLPQSVAAAVLEFMQGELLRAPRRVGHELRRELAGTWSARRGGYRILYEIHDDPEAQAAGELVPDLAEVSLVLVVDIADRSYVYRRR